MRSYEGTFLAFTYIVILFLRRLNAHLSSIVSSKPFQMPVDVVPRTSASSGSRLSSFGFSGTIAHGAFEARKAVTGPRDAKSLYRNRRLIAPSNTTRLSWLFDAPDPQQSGLDEADVFSGALSSLAEVLFSHHVVGGTIILPGVGYIELAFAASSGRSLTAVAFLRPCVLPEPGRGEKCVLRCMRRAEVLEIASARGTGSSSFASCFAGTLANIESDHKAPTSRQKFSACTVRHIDGPRNANVTEIHAVQHRIAAATGLGSVVQMRTPTFKGRRGSNQARFLCARKRLTGPVRCRRIKLCSAG